MIKCGDKVVIASDSQFYNLSTDDGNPSQDNPTGLHGEVVSMNSKVLFGFDVKVAWDNGRSNAYTTRDLEVIDEKE